MTAPTNTDPSIERPDGDPSDQGPTAGSIAEYVEAVRQHLGDLDDDERTDLLEDLELHLTEIRLETDQPFHEVVGTPAAYATELRQSAGLDPADRPSTPRPIGEMIDGASRRALAAAESARVHPWGRAVSDFLPELRPGWWVTRGYLLAVVLAVLTSSGQWRTAIGAPMMFGSTIIGLVVTVGLMVWSVRFGRADRSDGRARLIAAATLAAAVFGAFIVFVQANDRVVQVETVPGPDWLEEQGLVEPPLQTASPHTFDVPANIYAYLPDGTALDQVLLYDETGAPIDLPVRGYSADVGAEVEALPATGFDGRLVPNLYPRQLRLSEAENGSAPSAPFSPPVIESFPPVMPDAPSGEATEDEGENGDAPTADE